LGDAVSVALLTARFTDTVAVTLFMEPAPLETRIQ
jgi:hypothetical protein